MIFPRRLITPSTVSGALGTAVISGTRTISRTEAIRTPNVSLPMRKPTTWRSFSIDEFRRPRNERLRHTPNLVPDAYLPGDAGLLAAARDVRAPAPKCRA